MPDSPTLSDLDLRLDAAEAAAREAGALALARFRDVASLAVERKGLQDVVSEADREVEALIAERLLARFPDDGFLGEEQGFKSGRAGEAGPVWVVDPIDGTFCFLKGIPVWSISIGLALGGRCLLGAIVDPNAAEVFTGALGRGAFLNGRPIGVAANESLREGTVGVGFSHRSPPAELVAFLDRLLEAGGMYQRNGSGALSLAYVAAGRYVAYYEPHINSWDSVAGLALVEAAGGITNDFLAGNGLMEGNPIVAAAPGVAREILEMAGLG